MSSEGKNKKNYGILPLTLLTVLLLAGLVISIIYLLNRPEVKGYIRQEEEERIASLFISDLENHVADTVTVEEKEISYTNSELDYEDDRYEVIGGVKYTPEYALGHLECVLEIPSIKMRRGVYTGTVDEIQHDLDIWMTTAAHPDYVLGYTHYCIYGHNSPSQSLSFNDLRYVQPGDYFLLTTARFVFLYDVTDFFAEWRSTVTQEYVCNFSIPSDKCYIITCGRDENRYKDILVEGTLKKRYTLDEWEEVKGEITATRVETTVTREKEDLRPQAKIEIASSDDGISIRVTTPDGTPLKDIGIAVTDVDGIFVPGLTPEDLRTDEDGTVQLLSDALQEGVTYVVGTDRIDEEKLRTPNDVSFVMTKETVTTETVGTENTPGDHYITLWIIILSCTAVLLVVCSVLLIILLVAWKKGKTNA